ncbi:S8 family serine peptidase [Campylobacter sp. CCUG 57310]|uniref:S8 family serine peptidase n=1 Tax=Campylobacter sp. CCUG 57310 TaxID=2517362 RepID=UPI0015642255|nr:S8 family serine peptidase [Campylobacter sp. CCUG 57310]QKF91444.1 autotransporter domain-containing protein [Campylobacter sp. CCUG 57310]
MKKSLKNKLKKTQILLLAFPIVGFSSDYISVLRRSYELINLPSAYQNNPGITGEGVVVGIVDSFFKTNHPSIQNKDLGLFNVDQNSINEIADRAKKDSARHGTHIAGIILGKKLGNDEPYGIAQGAKYYGVGYVNLFSNYTGNLYNDLSGKNIKIINNSWSSQKYPSLGIGDMSNGYNTFNEHLNAEKLAQINENSKGVASLIRLAKEEKALIVIAAGNDGMLAPSSTAIVPSYDKSIKSWIVVGAMNGQDTKVDNSTGKRRIKFISGKCASNAPTYECDSLAKFSNAFKGASYYSIIAPGKYIDSANSYYNHSGFHNPKPEEIAKFFNMSGTSQATPMVSGAAALLQQKFPFLSGIDMANIILSTANDDVILPKLTVKSFNNTAFYHIIYIDNDVPMKNGQIDQNQVRQDLSSIGYSQTDIDTMLRKLFPKDGIVRLNKRDLIGQGVLDVDKALKGLAKLDANRFDAENIVEFNGEKQALYTIDTKGHNGEFTNDITQKLWDSSLHVADASNSPAMDIENIDKIGFRKIGEGTLTLAGNTDYKGLTIASGGTLKIKGEMTNSNLWAVDKGNLDLEASSKIKQNVYAKDGGNINLKGADITGNAVIYKNGKLITSSQNDHNIRGSVVADAGNIELKEGKLITPNVTLKNQGVLSGEGTIKGDLINESGIVKAGFKDGSLAIGNLNIEGKYTQNANGDLEIGFNPQARHTSFNANGYDILGGKLIYTPVYDKNSQDTFANNFEVIVNLGNLPTDNLTIDARDTNLFDFTVQDKNIIKINKKKDPFENNNNDDDFKNLINKILDIKLSKDFAKNNPHAAEYNKFFKDLDKASKSEFAKTLDSLENSPVPSDAKDNLWAQEKLTLDNTNFLLSTFSPMLLPSEPMASLSSDVTDQIAYDALQDSRRDTQISLNSNYIKLNHDEYKSKTYSTNLQAKKLIDENLLGGSIALATSKSTHKYSSSEQKRISVGISGLLDLGNNYSFIAQGNLGIGFNDLTRYIVGSSSDLKADYKSYLASSQIGILKNFNFENLSIKPVVTLNYSTVMQNKFNEQGGIFAKTYDKKRHETLSTSIGLHTSYQLSLNDYTKLNLNGFGYYTLRLNDEKINNKTHFSDFADKSFDQKTTAGRHSVYYGMDAELIHKRYFTRIGLSSEQGKNYSQINVLLSVGMEF